MTYREAFDHTGKRRIFARPSGHLVANVALFVGSLFVMALMILEW